MSRSQRKVFPELRKQLDAQLVEFRAKRFLRVLCINAASQHCNSRQVSNGMNDDYVTSNGTDGVINQAFTASSDQDKSTIFNTDVKTEDSDSNIVIFFLHGVGGCVEVWTSQIEFILNHVNTCRVVAVDFLGHGHSSAPDEKAAYDFSELAQDVTELFNRFHGRKNFVIGHSYGLVSVSLCSRFDTL
jgi:pimeloyl-ACP methyl ester carboxylesterase